MRIVALVTFLIGTAIFAAYCYFGDKMLFAGLGYIVVALMVNIPMALAGIGEAIESRDYKMLLSVGIVLLNVPAMLFYAWLALALMDTARITFTNATPHELTNIKLNGCEEIEMDNLQPGESETIWIDIPTDCTVNLVYNSVSDTLHTVSVEGYLTPGMGGSRNYNIGGFNDPDERVW